MLRRLAAWMIAALLALALVAPAAAGTRVALVIANSAYRSVPRLPNPPNDAKVMADALREVGFTVSEKNDLTKRDLEAALKTFAQAARGADVAVIYYAGHGMEQGGLNYLVPVDATLASDQDVDFDAIPLDLLLRSVDGATRLKLVILDACRNNPFLTAMQRSGGTRSIGRGLARVEPSGDTLVAYAAREGSTAADGDGGDSPFTKALARRMVTPGLEIRLLFGQVRDEVMKVTDQRQEPAIYGSLGGDPFYFVAPAVPVSVAAAPVAPLTPRTAADWRLAAMADRRAGALDKAVADYGQALQVNPGDTESLYARGVLHVERSEWDPAIADFDAVLKLRPKNSGAYNNRGRARDGKGDVAGAIADATEAIRLAPRSDAPYRARARYYRRQASWDLALADANQVVALQPDGDAYYQRGAVYDGKGDVAAARADYDKALDLDPKNARAAEAKGRLAKGK
ncbi:caspase family protein [Phenylobacterium sp.]|uniref:caspase family protein n=1 Tax=Phenylobacterium sp. TaxID=1871053 RepID=UPI0025CF149D|nr:caspase family protein [Phenylobacterium sp.]